MTDWEAQRYRRFAGERLRAAADLLARVPPGPRRKIVDLGCGDGGSTTLLAEAYPDADVLGVDTSHTMLAAAQEELPRARFEQVDVAQWRGGPVDLIFANAVLQWIPDHLRVIAELPSQLAPGGCLAIQMPDNLNEPAHVEMRETAAEPAFRVKLAEAAGARGGIGTFGDYHRALAILCDDIDVWRTTYVHRLAGADGVVDWFRATGLRPFLNPLDEAERQEFLRLYRARISASHPALPDGSVLLPFPRLFMVAVPRKEG